MRILTICVCGKNRWLQTDMGNIAGQNYYGMNAMVPVQDGAEHVVKQVRSFFHEMSCLG